jgi:hypothetical protein
MIRPLALALSLLSLGSLRVCGAETDAAPPTVAASATVTASPPTTIPVMASPPGRRGGTVIVAGTHQVEVVPKADGEIVAYVAGPGGSVPAPSQVNLTVTVQGVDAQAHPVVLAWNAQDLRYEGRLVGVAPAPGPAQVTLVVAGAPAVATAPMIVIVPATLVVEGDAPHARVEVRAPGTIEVRGPEGHVEVRDTEDHGDVRVIAPGLFIQPPSARLDVRIGLPPPPPPPSARININLGGNVEVREGGHGRGRGRGHDD